MRLLGLFIAVSLAAAAPAAGQARHAMEGATATAALQAGDIDFANSGSAAAQAPFRDGLALLHDFEYARAALAFQQAEAADPNFAMAYWGEAMTHNHAIWMEQDLPAARAALAKLGPTPKDRQARAPTAREQGYLAAVETLYGDGSKETRDFRYADAMAALHARYPDDVDATALYALSLLGTCHQGRDFATYMKAAALLEEVYPTHMRHPGVLHYLIHSYDDPIHAPLGLRAARRYGALAPDAPHALHMTSHIFLALGMWGEVIDANVKALRAEGAIAADAVRPARGCGHYFTWLMYGELQEGRAGDAAASLAACRLAAQGKLGGPNPTGVDPDAGAVNAYAFMRLLQAVETGRWDSADALTWSGTGFEAADFYDAYGAAVAAYRAKDAARLQAAVARLQALRAPLLAQIAAQGDDSISDRQSLGVIADEMGAAARILAGDQEGGLASLRKVAESEGALPMEFGPPLIALPAWELLGEALLRAGKPVEAAQAFRNALARAPGRTRSLQGLLKSEQLAGDAGAEAATTVELARYPRPAV